MTTKLYRPANGTEGMIFMAAFCDRCKLEPTCKIMLSTMAYDTTDAEYPTEWRYVDDKPTCTAYKDANEKARDE